MTELEAYVFSGCNNLTSAIIGDGVTSIEEYTFRECTRLSTVIIGNSVTYIGEAAFSLCNRLSSITIPKSVKAFGPAVFFRSTNLTTIESLIEEPFAFGSNLVDDFSKVILFVPAGTKSKYESTDGWKRFHHIVEGSPAHVDEGLQVENDVSTIYNLNGHRIVSPQRGINIVRTKDGKIKKVLVK